MKGLIATKVGMTQVFDEDGNLTPVTVIRVDPNVVVARKTKETFGYDAVVLGLGEMKQNHITKPYAGQFPEGVTPKRHLKEFRDFGSEPAVGDQIGVELFEGTKYVDVTATSKGKGFQGVMKRWGFHGGRATHGNSISHRSHGSTGGCQDPGRVFKNKKMAGHMGSEKKTLQNIKIFSVDKERGLLLVRGSVTGSRGNLVFVRSAKKCR